MWKEFLEVNATASNFVIPQKIAHFFSGWESWFFFLKTAHTILFWLV